MELQDLDSECHRLVLTLLPPKDLGTIASTCRYFYRSVFDGVFAERLWKTHCTALLGPGIVALHEASIPAGHKAGPMFWRDLWLAGSTLDTVRWWRHGAHELKTSVEQADEADAAAAKAAAEEEAARMAADNDDGLGEHRRSAVLAEADAAQQGAKTLKSKLARSGHAANLVGSRVVITGGILRDGSLLSDIIIVDLATLCVSRPEMEGDAPSTRFRHTACPMACTPGSLLWHDVKEALGPATKVSSGQLLLIFGGYNTMGEEFGADSTFVLWAAEDGSRYVWIPVVTSGEPPSPRFHHTCECFDGGRKVVLYGGEGYMLDDAGEGPAPCVYVLDADSLTWHKMITHAPVEAHSPGVRSLHVTTIRRSPDTNREELVVVGGYYSSVLAEMTPFTLDLTTFYWRCWPGLPEAPSGGWQGTPPSLPAPRQRMAAQRLTSEWMLVSGGSPASGSFLEDLHRLHVPTLLWAPQPAVAGRPSRALRRIAGHTLSGLLAFGGCIPTIMGIMPVAKVDLLLLGHHLGGLIPTDPAAQAAPEAMDAPIRTTGSGRLRDKASTSGRQQTFAPSAKPAGVAQAVPESAAQPVQVLEQAPLQPGAVPGSKEAAAAVEPSPAGAPTSAEQPSSFPEAGTSQHQNLPALQQEDLAPEPVASSELGPLLAEAHALSMQQGASSSGQGDSLLAAAPSASAAAGSSSSGGFLQEPTGPDPASDAEAAAAAAAYREKGKAKMYDPLLPPGGSGKAAVAAEARQHTPDMTGTLQSGALYHQLLKDVEPMLARHSSPPRSPLGAEKAAALHQSAAAAAAASVTTSLHYVAAPASAATGSIGFGKIQLQGTVGAAAPSSASATSLGTGKIRLQGAMAGPSGSSSSGAVGAAPAAASTASIGFGKVQLQGAPVGASSGTASGIRSGLDAKAGAAVHVPVGALLQSSSSDETGESRRDAAGSQLPQPGFPPTWTDWDIAKAVDSLALGDNFQLPGAVGPAQPHPTASHAAAIAALVQPLSLAAATAANLSHASSSSEDNGGMRLDMAGVSLPAPGFTPSSRVGMDAMLASMSALADASQTESSSVAAGPSSAQPAAGKGDAAVWGSVPNMSVLVPPAALHSSPPQVLGAGGGGSGTFVRGSLHFTHHPGVASRGVYAVSSIRNDEETLLRGPNPFAALREGALVPTSSAEQPPAAQGQRAAPNATPGFFATPSQTGTGLPWLFKATPASTAVFQPAGKMGMAVGGSSGGRPGPIRADHLSDALAGAKAAVGQGSLGATGAINPTPRTAQERQQQLQRWQQQQKDSGADSLAEGPATAAAVPYASEPSDVPNADLLRDVEPPSRTMREPQLPLAREHLARQIGRPPLRKASEDVGWSDNEEFESATSDDEPTTPRSTPIPDEPAPAATAAEPQVQAAAAAEPDKATAPASLPAPTSPGGLILAEPLPVGSAAAFFNSSSAALSPDTPWLAWAGKGAITGIQGAPGVPDDVSTVLWRDVKTGQLYSDAHVAAASDRVVEAAAAVAARQADDEGQRSDVSRP